ncbi:transposable element Tc1 transposase [Trichonephila clavipes]|nr:transposable element Tc1 transposase [Trichonephila clavipes]
MPRRRIRAHYEQLSEFERDHIIGLKERGTTHRYVNGILRTVSLPFVLQYPGLILQQDNAKSRTTRVAVNGLTAYQILSWPGRFPDPCPIEHVWDMMGRQLHIPGNVDDLA